MAKKKDQDQPAEEMKITYRRLDTIKPLPGNAKLHAVDDIVKSIATNGFIDPLGINIITGHDMDGNGRLEALKMLYAQGEPPPKNIREVKEKINDEDVTVWYAPTVDLEFDPETEPIVALALNRLNEKGGYDTAAVLAILEQAQAFGRLEETGYDTEAMAGILAKCAELQEQGNGNGNLVGEPQDAEPQIDKAAELNEKWKVKTGDVFTIGAHRLMCGDSTKAADVGRLMSDGKAVLCHADPPYGMGKEADGVANDNLYAAKLDAFQMKWWTTFRPHLEDNGSAYIWGNAEDLWRLWYVGGLKDSERLTLRNEVVWDKGHGQGMESDQHRMFPTASERVLFFMLGEQGFNNNADNYWEGWEPIRSWLSAERERSGLTTDQCNKICGKQNMTQSAFTKGGFRLILEEDYNKLREATGGKFFKREHDELKREFYETRAYFDNTHDNMTDVWQFSRVTGEERWSHATPKPVDMIARALKSSSPEGAAVAVPFGGSGSDFVAGENTGRKIRGMELQPEYCAVILERMTTAFPHLSIHRAE